ncbi:hypothetical protein [Phycicoccus sp. Soil802]|uniref:hypothetical protein n=1 Tax=Phycicoccus sp. Soil802 TaxID=1736414 RepID=UPI000AE02756|nr:hypothetical protein [Phycicoccus sp. Soil802]
MVTPGCGASREMDKGAYLDPQRALTPFYARPRRAVPARAAGRAAYRAVGLDAGLGAPLG